VNVDVVGGRGAGVAEVRAGGDLADKAVALVAEEEIAGLVGKDAEDAGGAIAVRWAYAATGRRAAAGELGQRRRTAVAVRVGSDLRAARPGCGACRIGCGGATSANDVHRVGGGIDAPYVSGERIGLILVIRRIERDAIVAANGKACRAALGRRLNRAYAGKRIRAREAGDVCCAGVYLGHIAVILIGDVDVSGAVQCNAVWVVKFTCGCRGCGGVRAVAAS
jgi:hypothetical protein